MRRLLVLAPLLVACSSDPPPPAKQVAPPRPRRETREEPRGAAGPRPTGGSSDGVTCEEARDTVGEDLTIGGKKGGKDLDPKALGAPLNEGAFLGACDVPQATKVAVCAAVKNGAAIGVTVAMSPADPELERCVAGKIRSITFPASPRLDVVKTDF